MRHGEVVFRSKAGIDKARVDAMDYDTGTAQIRMQNFGDVQDYRFVRVSGFGFPSERLVADNPRFLILPRVEIPNLGSRTLSIVLGRMPEDWIERFSTAPVPIETFVQIPRYAGTVLRASG